MNLMTHLSDKQVILVKKLEFPLQVILLLILNKFAIEFFYKALPLEMVYHNKSIFFSLFHNINLHFLFLMFLPLLVWKTRWEELIEEKNRYIKYFIFFIMGIWAWKTITLDFNLYFNQPYHLDRSILFLLVLLAFRFPVALIYFLLFSIIFFNQVSYPTFAGVFPSQYIDSTPLIEILMLFIMYMAIKKVYSNFSILSFIVVALCLHAANYFIPGLAKVLISENYVEWVYLNDLSNIMAAQYFQGWLADVISWETMQSLLTFVHTNTIPLQLGAFITQLAVAVIFINKKYTLLLFSTFEALHIGVFLVSGIFFWKWILLNLSIIYVISKLDDKQIKKIFNVKMMLLTVPMIIFGYVFFKPAWLGWYDTPLNNTFKIYATNSNGERFEVDQNLLAPYDILFAQRLFNFSMNETLRFSWGASNPRVMEEISKLSFDHNKIFDFERQYGTNVYNIQKIQRFEDFLKTYFKYWNENINKKLVWNYLSPPKHVYASLAWDKKTIISAPIEHIEVMFFKTFYDHKKNEIIVLEEKCVLRVKI